MPSAPQKRACATGKSVLTVMNSTPSSAAASSLKRLVCWAQKAEQRLRRLGYKNITVRIGDGFYGWPEQAPFDAIIVAAVADDLPEPLLDQLRPGGRMIIPVHRGIQSQQLVLVEKDKEGNVSTRDILPVLFVPLTGDHD